MKNILLTGTYNSMNKGDAAMELSTAWAMAKAFPESSIRIHSPFPHMDRPFYSPVPVIKCSRRRLIWGTTLILRAWLWRFSKASVWIKGNPELESYAGADIVVDLSGDMQTESYGPHVAYSHFIPIALAIAMGKPIMLCAQSVGPFKWTTPIAKFLFNRVDMITVRDKISEDYLKGMKIDCPVIHTADMAFLLEPTSSERIDEILEKEGISKEQGPFLGVSVSGLIASHFSKRNSLAGKTDFYRFMAKELDAVISQMDMVCVFVAHVTGPGDPKDDRKAAERVKAHMKQAHRAHIIRGDYRPEELKGIISRFHIHTGARMHASIAAVTTGVPVAAIAYSHKTPGVMAQFGLADYVIDISTWQIDELIIKIKLLLESHERLSKDLEHKVAALRNQSSENIQFIKSILRNKN